MNREKFEIIKGILLNLDNKGVKWNKVDDPNLQNLYLKGKATKSEADKVYAEMIEEGIIEISIMDKKEASSEISL